MSVSGSGSTKASLESDELPTTKAKNKKAFCFFSDVNPEQTDCKSVFDHGLPGYGGDDKLAVGQNTFQEVIDAELNKHTLQGGTRKVRDRDTSTEDCFTIVPLANPKGSVKQFCELCHKLATLCCKKCTVTYYCSWKHRRLDTYHHMLCSKLKIIRWPQTFIDNANQRKRLSAQRLFVMEKLLEDLVRQGYINLFTGNLALARASLSQSLNYVKRVYGENGQHLQLITIYTALSETEIMMSDFNAAEKTLVTVNNIILNIAEDKDLRDLKLNCAKALINKAQGILAYANNDFLNAIYHFSECVYYMSEATSPTDARTSCGYYHLGKSFLAQSKHLEGEGLLSFCAEIWRRFMTDVLMAETAEVKTRYGKRYVKSTELMTKYLELEAKHQLSGLWEYFRFKEETRPQVICKLLLCRGILLFSYQKYPEAKEYAKQAISMRQHVGGDADLLSVCKRLEKHATSRDLIQQS